MCANKYWLAKDEIDSQFDTKFVIQFMDEIGIYFILTANTINRRGAFVMGTKEAPTYATLVLRYLEEHLYNKMETSTQKFLGISGKTFWGIS